MAYVIGKKILKDTETELQSYAYGITLPIKRGSNGFFEQAFTTYDQAKANLKNLLLTAKGERIMQPNFGCGIHSLLFEPLDGVFEDKLQTVITETVSYWLPYITIEEIDVEMTDEMKDRHQANMRIGFRVGNQIDTQEITFRVQG